MATGGVVRARPGGLHALIGEGRWDEAVVPLDGASYLVDRSGVTALPTAPALASDDFDLPDLPQGTARALRPVIHTHVHLNGREIGEAVLDDFDDRGARR